MHTQQKYKQMVFYVEACESGSMFDQLLPTDINGMMSTVALRLDIYVHSRPL